MEPIKKMSTGVALIQFRNQLGGLKLDSEQRKVLMEQFRSQYERIGDFDLASMEVFDDLIPKLSRGRREKKQFTAWWEDSVSSPEKVRKEIVQKLFGFGSSGAVKQLRDYIDRELLSGTPQSVIRNSLVLDAQKYFGRDLSEKELDIIDFNLTGEKVRLREQGKYV